MISVLYLTNNAGRASTTVGTRGWIKHLHDHGLRAVIVSPILGEFSEWAEKEFDVPSYRQDLPFPSKTNPVPYFTALWRLGRIVRRYSITLIHAIEHDVYPIAADLARQNGLPIVVGVHCRMGRGFGQWAFGGRRQPRRIFFLTNASREICRPSISGIVAETNWRVLPNGLDTDSFRPDSEAGEHFRQVHGLGAGPLVGAASWLRAGKQLEHTYKVVSGLPDDVTLVVAGGIAPGEEAYAERVLADGKRILGPRFRYLGCLDNLLGFYNALDLYINTSKEETCSISILESLACGCPVVGYPSVSVAEQVLPSGGEIVDQDNSEQLTAAVVRWLKDDDHRAAARRGARQRVTEAFDIRKIADRLWDEYSGVLTERKSGSQAADVAPRLTTGEAVL